MSIVFHIVFHGVAQSKYIVKASIPIHTLNGCSAETIETAMTSVNNTQTGVCRLCVTTPAYTPAMPGTARHIDSVCCVSQTPPYIQDENVRHIYAASDLIDHYPSFSRRIFVDSAPLSPHGARRIWDRCCNTIRRNYRTGNTNKRTARADSAARSRSSRARPPRYRRPKTTASPTTGISSIVCRNRRDHYIC